jgi:hypothetical protein
MTKWLRKNKGLLFRIGLAGIFLANSVTAWVAPDEFRDLLTSNSLLSHIGHPDLLVKLVGVNDGALALLILSGQFRKLAATWGSLWIMAVIYVTGFWTPDFIEHFGVLALLAYYASLSPKD